MPEPIEPLEPFNQNVEAYFVESESTHKVRYAVSLSGDGQWSCSCPDWMYRRPAQGCKHIQRVVSWRSYNNVVAAPKNTPRFAALDV